MTESVAPLPRIAFVQNDEFGTNRRRRSSDSSLFHQRWQRRSSFGLELPTSEEWLAELDSSDDEVSVASHSPRIQSDSRRRSSRRSSSNGSRRRSSGAQRSNLSTQVEVGRSGLATHVEQVPMTTLPAISEPSISSAKDEYSDSDQSHGRPAVKSEPNLLHPSTVIGAIIAKDNERHVHPALSIDDEEESRETIEPLLSDRSESDAALEVDSQASELSLPGQAESDASDTPNIASSLRRRSMTGDALQAQMQLENGIAHRQRRSSQAPKPESNSNSSSRVGSRRGSSSSIASIGSRKFKLLRRNRSRRNSRAQSNGPKPAASDKRPPTANSVITKPKSTIGRGQLSGSFFGRHSTVSPLMTAEAWKEEEEEQDEEDHADAHSCGMGWTVLKQRLSDALLGGTVFRPREETRLGRVWILIITIICAYNILIIPFRLGFRGVWDNVDWRIIIYTLDYVGDLLLLVDMYLNFRTAYIHDGLEVKDAHEVASNYYNKGFLRDLISTLPVDLLFWDNPWAKVLARLPRLIRVGPMLRQLEELSRSTELGTFIQILKLFSGVMILCHYLGCFYFLVSYIDGFTPMDMEEGWAPYEYIRHVDVAQQYFISFTWSVDVVAGAFVGTAPPTTNLQRALMILADFSHVLVIAFFIGSVEALLAEWNRDAEEFRGRMVKLNQFMSRRRLNKELQQRIRNYYFHAWSRQGAFDNPSILRDLPVNLRTEVNVCTHGKVLAKVPLFKACDKTFLNQLTEKIKLRIYAPGDMVVTVGEEGDEMFILNRGDVDILNREGKVLVTLGEGSVIGEVAFFSPNSKRTASVRASTWCDFACLEKQDFMTVASRFPEERMGLESLAHARLSKDILRKSIGSHQLFEGCDKDFVDAVCERFHPYEFTGGETLFVEGEPSDAWLFVGLGMLKTYEKLPGVTKKHDKTITTEFKAGAFLEVSTFMSDASRKTKCKAVGPTSILALDKTAFEQAMLEFSTFEIVSKNARAIARMERLASAKAKFRRAMSRLRTSNMLGHVASREPSIAGSEAESVASSAVAPENFKGLADEVLDNKLKEALKLVTAITTARTQRLGARSVSGSGLEAMESSA